MRPYTTAEIRGTYATLLLPIQQNDAIDFGLMREQLQYFIASGMDGVYSNGTAGEFFTESEDEFVQVNQLLAEVCEAANVPYQIGASFPTPHLSLERIRRAAAFKPSAIQVVLPDWWPPTLDESLNFLLRAAEVAGDVPLILYNPPHAKRVLTPAEFAILCDRLPTLVGIKTGAGGPDWYDAMQPLMKRLSVFVPGHTLATGFSRGAAGAYSNVACLQPGGSVRWNRLMETDLTQALAIEQQIQGFMTNAILPFREKFGRSNMALDKLLAWIGNWSTMDTKLRWPYIGIAPAEATGLRERARREIPFLFENESA
jgi:dihydrodipicolinate synthase/N-acetylneuraminate lyase